MRKVVLSVAGSDSGGGAGIQADLRMFSRLGVFGTTVVTAVTAQNLDAVTDVFGVTRRSVAAQLDAVFAGFDVVAAKTGMLWSAETVRLLAERCRARGEVFWVIDPVMIATSGARLLAEEAIEAYRHELIPAATVVTPNLDEAALLLGVERIERGELFDAAATLSERLRCAVLLKGGHLEGDPVDVLAELGEVTSWPHPRVHGVNTHGTGCMLSAALVAFLARGFKLREACAAALTTVSECLARPLVLNAATRLAGIEPHLR